MKKVTKILCKVLPVVLVGLLIVSNVFGINVPSTIGGTANSSVKTLTENVWQTVAGILQILAVAAVVVAGVRYMFASASDKADIKKQTVVLIAGAALVFGATAILSFVSKTTNELIK